MTKNRNIVCVLKSGGDFSFADVRLLANAIYRYNKDVKLYCITDAVNEKEMVVFHKGAEIILLPMRHKWQGWWSLMNIYSPDYKHLRPFMLVGLDTLFQGNISSVFPDATNWDKFIPIEDFYQKGELASGVLWTGNESKIKIIWDAFISKSDEIISKGERSDYFLRSVVKEDLFFQNITNEIISFKPQGLQIPSKPNKAIVCFHGHPRIPQARQKWVKEYINENN